MKISIRKIISDEAKIALEFTDAAREHQRELGFSQWEDNYPNLEVILEDVKYDRAYFLLKDGVPFGYVSIGFDGEPTYDNIDGEWKSDRKYGVVHRLAFGKNYLGCGLSKTVFEAIKNFCVENGFYSIRIDTHEDNKKMQHILEREGYEYCGIATLPVGLRLAYEYLI